MSNCQRQAGRTRREFPELIWVNLISRCGSLCDKPARISQGVVVLVRSTPRGASIGHRVGTLLGEVVGLPYTTNAGKNVNTRVQRVDKPGGDRDPDVGVV
jgi:hypothetical protein